MAEAPMISVRGISKCFKLYRSPWARVVEWGSFGRATTHRPFWAVRDVSFEVNRGECMGVIGPNGSGKSTMLKILTGAMHATEGDVEIRGRVLSLLELGTGMNQKMTGRENIFNAARLLNFPPGFARERIDEIEEFASIGQFFDRPIAFYSSGMRVRLAFSMFACFRPEVFIVDEALSVGDVRFQQKCAERIRELLDEGTTMLFVSHDTGAVVNLCTQAMVLEEGRATFHGRPEEAVNRYFAAMRVADANLKKKKPKWTERQEREIASSDEPEAAGILRHDVIGDKEREGRHGGGRLQVEAARILDGSGNDTLRTRMSGVLEIQVLVRAVEAVARPRVGLHVVNRFNERIYAASNYQLGHVLPDLDAGERLVVTFHLTMDVAPEPHTLTIETSVPVPGDVNAGLLQDQIGGVGPIGIESRRDELREYYGAARLPMTVAHTRLAETAETT
ncbi:MAG: ABC transporter ATP-binding protein [Phycisphaerales bacterium]|nr:ABC transporter ATP-binding protein [Phycisphaerales bacterium]